jgi:4-amino-4-deoxy-L-arabinose transferase-like glycosyltransferase
MVRLVAFNVIFFLVPFGIYAGWLLATRGTLGGANDWPIRTITWLAMGGAVLLIVALVAFTQFTGAPAGSKYVPAKVIDGVLVPGHFE